MDERTLEILHLMTETGTPAFQQQASNLISGDIAMSEQDLNQLIDGFLNDPYLTRFPRR